MGLVAVLMLVAFAGSISWGYEGSQPLLGDFWPTWFLVATTIGVSGALWVARQSGFENLLTFDMGGTSTDVSLCQAGCSVWARLRLRM